MKNQHELAARFARAHRVWIATLHVRLYRGAEFVESRALVRTTAGFVGKREVVGSTRRPVSVKRRFGLLRGDGIAAVSALAVAIGLFLLLRAFGG